MSSLKIVLPSEVDAINPIAGDVWLSDLGAMRMTETLAEEVAQQLYVRFRWFLNEWFLNRAMGVPWFQRILGQRTPLPIVTRILRRVCETCPGVSSVATLNATKDNPRREISVSFRCLLTDGTEITSDQYGPFVITGVA